jgi:hypothetical protein
MCSFFRGRRGDLIKMLWWDGLCLFAKRLEKGRFVLAESGKWHGGSNACAIIHADGRHRLAATTAHARGAVVGVSTQPSVLEKSLQSDLSCPLMMALCSA